jgi:glycosyltransferase involved in cell wall biosynthesis
MVCPVINPSVQASDRKKGPEQGSKTLRGTEEPARRGARISVVMTTYNGEPFLRMQIDSLLAQTFPPFEIIIQDDRSTDGTWRILEEYAESHPHVHIFQNKERLGVNQNFISAFGKARGEYISICDQDDVWHKQKLEKYILEFEKDDLTLVYSDSWVCDVDLKEQFVYHFSDFNLYEIAWGSPAFGHTIMFRRELLSLIRNMDEIDFIYEWLIGVVAVANGKTSKVKMPLTYWRRHNYTLTDLEYKAPEVKYERPLMVVYSVFFGLLKKERLPNFSWQFDNIHKLLLNFDHLPTVRGLLRFLNHYKKETVSGIFFSCLLYFLVRQDLPLRERIKAGYFPIYRYHFYKRDGAGLRGK